MQQVRTAGYSAAIIFRATGSDEQPLNLTRHGDNETDGLAIPVFTVARRDGVALWERYSSGGEFDFLLISANALDHELKKLFSFFAIVLLFLGTIFVVSSQGIALVTAKCRQISRNLGRITRIGC